MNPGDMLHSELVGDCASAPPTKVLWPHESNDEGLRDDSGLKGFRI